MPDQSAVSLWPAIGSDALFRLGQTVRFRRSNVSNEPRSKLPCASIHHFWNFCAGGSQRSICCGESVLETRASGNNNFFNSGCAASLRLVVSLIDPSGNESSKSFPCFDHPTLPDLLDANHLSWRYYTVGDSWNELWNGPAAIRHLRFGPDGPMSYARTSRSSVTLPLDSCRR